MSEMIEIGEGIVDIGFAHTGVYFPAVGIHVKLTGAVDPVTMATLAQEIAKINVIPGEFDGSV